MSRKFASRKVEIVHEPIVLCQSSQISILGLLLAKCYPGANLLLSSLHFVVYGLWEQMTRALPLQCTLKVWVQSNVISGPLSDIR